MTKTWQVFFTGKFQFFLITTVASFLVFILIIFRMTAKEGGEFEDNLIEGLFGFSLFIIAWFTTFIGFIRKKKNTS